MSASRLVGFYLLCLLKKIARLAKNKEYIRVHTRVLQKCMLNKQIVVRLINSNEINQINVLLIRKSKTLNVSKGRTRSSKCIKFFFFSVINIVVWAR